MAKIVDVNAAIATMKTSVNTAMTAKDNQIATLKAQVAKDATDIAALKAQLAAAITEAQLDPVVAGVQAIFP